MVHKYDGERCIHCGCNWFDVNLRFPDYMRASQCPPPWQED